MDYRLLCEKLTVFPYADYIVEFCVEFPFLCVVVIVADIFENAPRDFYNNSYDIVRFKIEWG